MPSAERRAVTFRADEAPARIAAFVEWSGGRARYDDMGVRGDVRLYRVNAKQWQAYSRQVTDRKEATTSRLMRRYRCGGCTVTAPRGALGQHQKASGHTGRTPLAKV